MLGETNNHHKPWFMHQYKDLLSMTTKLSKQVQLGEIEQKLILNKLSNEYHQLLNLKKKKYEENMIQAMVDLPQPTTMNTGCY